MESLCRTCMVVIGVNKNFVSVFGWISNDSTLGTVADLLAKLFGTEIKKDDYLPKNICTECSSTLAACIKFEQKCKQAQSSLQKMLAERQPYETIPDLIDTSQIKAEPAELLPLESNNSYGATQENDTTDATISNYFNVIEKFLFQCCLCSGVLHGLDEYKDHGKLIHNVPPSESGVDLKCYMCMTDFDNHHELEYHQKKNIQQCYQCISCNAVVELPEHANQHFQQQHSIKVEPAELTIMDNSNQWIKLRHKSLDQMLEHDRCCCLPGCHEVFPNEEQLILHAQQKHEVAIKMNRIQSDSSKPYRCEVCLRTFLRLQSRKAHQLRQYFCTECPFRANYRQKLTIHQSLKHGGERPFACPHCDKSFLLEVTLQNHMQYHATERQFDCEFCSKSFITKVHLKRHVNQCHSSEKPYKCYMCPSAFKRPDSLRKHVVLHAKEKPFQCGACDLSFAQEGQLEKHQQFHDMKYFICKDCGKGFDKECKLKLHIERCHLGLHGRVRKNVDERK